MMHHLIRCGRAIGTLVVALACVTAVGADDNVLRVASYNVALYRGQSGELAGDLRSGEDNQARRLAEVIQRVRPDVLLLCEIDDDPQNDPAKLFAELYLAKPQAGQPPIVYPYRFTAPVNTGRPSEMDLNNNGQTTDPEDAWGYGRYPGQYGMAVLSRLPIDRAASRTFQRLLWSDLPEARVPRDPLTNEPYYERDVWQRLRLPSKSFWDVVVSTPNGTPLHLICSHPTPPVFDGPEDRNGCRNADEVRLVREYVSGGLAEYFVDDAGVTGPLRSDSSFVVLGDLNADPNDGSGRLEAIQRLLACPRLAPDPSPQSEGATAASEKRPGLNAEHLADAACDTGDFGSDGHGNLRIDYALPSKQLRVVGSGVYWPKPGQPGAPAARASDHRMVWVDVSSDATATP